MADVIAHRGPCLSPCELPLALLPDGALGLVLSFGSFADLIASNMVCRSWVLHGNRVDLWKALGDTFEVAMPISLGPQQAGNGSRKGMRGGVKRVLRSASNAKRTFFRSYAASVRTNGFKHDATLSEAYTLFRQTDSVPRLRKILRRRWGITFPNSTYFPRTSVAKISPPADEVTQGGGGSSGVGMAGDGGQDGLSTGRGGSMNVGCSSPSKALEGRQAGRSSSSTIGDSRWALNVDHRHSIWEGNTLLNFAVRCGRRKCVEFLMRRMGADTEIPDYGGFTPLLNSAWRGDLPLVKQLLAAGARVDVEGVSRGEGPYDPLEWAERKNRPVTAAFLRVHMGKTADGAATKGDSVADEGIAYPMG